MIDTLSSVLPWLVPPLLGAVIGYVTNAVAISMLFRPYREIRIFRIRVPFTPGIIPRQRGELAESIASTVEAELLNEETVRGQTEKPEFRKSLQSGISSFSERVLSMPFNRWGSFFPGEEQKAGDLARGFIFSEAFEHLVGGVVSRAADALLDAPLSSFEKQEGGLQTALNSLLTRIPQEGLLDRAEEGIESWVRRQAEKGARVSDVIKLEDLSALRTILDGFYMPIFEGIMAFLKKDTTLDELEIRGRRFLHDVIDNLSALQRLLISAGQYNRTLDENMDKIVVDLVAHIERAGRTEENKKNVLNFIEEEIRRLSNTGIGDTAEKHRRFMLIVGEIFRKVKDILADSRFTEAVSARIAQALLKEGRTVRDILGSLPGIQRGEVETYLTGVIVRLTRNLFSGQGDKGEKDTVGDRLSSDFGSQNLQGLLSLRAENKDRVDGYLTDRTIDLINKKIPDILGSVDIHGMVVDRINSFDIVKMEQLILRVVKKHLRWITVFGGFLGAVIGLAQIAVNRFL